ncbi:lysozyme inhibitor LprI family protein [Dyella koreensis]|uniref:DUF1311 domain-containing protein n=1 Tax=Dyella koreensis TaxID=311235 RepID=A0ABW8K6W3_9GAMM
MKTVKTLAISAALLICATGAIAADSTSQIIKRDAPKGITAAFYVCIDKAGSDTIAIGSCLTTERQTQDARLNAAYKALLGKLNAKAKERLVSAERTWLEFHSKSSSFESALYSNEVVDDLQVTENEVFRLCERANTLDKYLTITNDQ